MKAILVNSIMAASAIVFFFWGYQWRNAHYEQKKFEALFLELCLEKAKEGELSKSDKMLLLRTRMIVEEKRELFPPAILVSEERWSKLASKVSNR